MKQVTPDLYSNTKVVMSIQLKHWLFVNHFIFFRHSPFNIYTTISFSEVGESSTEDKVETSKPILALFCPLRNKNINEM